MLDPFSIPAVADELVGSLASLLAAASPARMHPEESYQVTVNRLRAQKVKLHRKPLPVAVVKATCSSACLPLGGSVRSLRRDRCSGSSGAAGCRSPRGC